MIDNMRLQKGVNFDMERSYQYDIVIVGGGTAGVAAAVGAAKAGAKTLLVERNAYLGGEATNSGVNCILWILYMRVGSGAGGERGSGSLCWMR